MLALSLPAAAYTNLYVFGDSLVDAGNVQAFALGFGQPDPTPAALGYFDGRFANGPVFSDVLNTAIEGVISDNSLAGGDNFAFGGARARNDGGIPDLPAQVAQFNAAHGGVADPGALYMINVGGNDVFDMLSNPGQIATITSAAAAAIQTSVLSLQGMGASAILFVGVGDVGSPPAANGAEGPGRSLSISLNSAIQAAMPAGVMYFNTIGFYDEVTQNPTAFGLPAGLLTEVSCLNSGAAAPAGPPNCNAYTFFDDVHITTQVSSVLGNALVAFVPEPGTGLLLALGLVGMAVRRRSAAA